MPHINLKISQQLSDDITRMAKVLHVPEDEVWLKAVALLSVAVDAHEQGVAIGLGKEGEPLTNVLKL